MCSYKKTFKLRQNTPLWHSQHMQDGATLRASEVKPKLDQFLIANCPDIQLNEKWFVGEDRKALDYKLRIYSEGRMQKVEGKLPLFFGNMGSSKKPDELLVSGKEAVFSEENDGLCLEFFCLHSELLTHISDHLNEFFLIHNFGTRQSKGYGSFSVVKEAEDGFEDRGDLLGVYQVGDGVELYLRSFFVVDVQGSKKPFGQLFEAIETFSKSIRSGINDCKNLCFKGTYCEFRRFSKDLDVNLCKSRDRCEHKKKCSVFYSKSFLYYYVTNRHGEDWDKRKLKRLFINGEKVEDLKLWRDMLGLAENTKLNKGILIKDGGSDFRRFKSPIFIKPVKMGHQYIVYVGYYNTIEVDRVWEKTVTLKYKGDAAEVVVRGNNMAPLDLNDYFNYFLENGKDLLGKVNARVYEYRGVRQQGNCSGNPYYKHLQSIYMDLKNNRRQ